MRSPTGADWQVCRQVARQHGRSFFLASRLLPPARRRGILAAYAFCRVADDIVDHAVDGDLELARSTLASWERQLDVPTDPVAIAFAQTRAHYGVPDGPVRQLLSGIASDLVPADFVTWADLERYCYLVAGTVGLMVAPILGCRNDAALPHAAELGIAMQLTNILRDVAEDAVMGRLYLPQKELARYGVRAESVLNGMPAPGFREFMAFQVGRARLMYASALRGVPSLAPSGRATTLAAARLYAGILDQIEAMDYDVFQARAVVPSGQKARIMVGVARDWAGSIPARDNLESTPTVAHWASPVRLPEVCVVKAAPERSPSHD